MKVGVVGAGAVGSACLLSLAMRGSAREVVLVNRGRKRARGVVTDVQYGAVLSPPSSVREGDYSDLTVQEAGLPIFTDRLIGDTSVTPPSRTTSSGRRHELANCSTYSTSALGRTIACSQDRR